MASVTFENVVKRYGNVTAVNNLNLEIPDKEFLVFVGPSGCGPKTSTMPTTSPPTFTPATSTPRWR